MFTFFADGLQFNVDNVFQYAFENCGYNKNDETYRDAIGIILNSGNKVDAIIDNRDYVMYLPQMFRNTGISSIEASILMDSPIIM